MGLWVITLHCGELCGEGAKKHHTLTPEGRISQSHFEVQLGVG